MDRAESPDKVSQKGLSAFFTHCKLTCHTALRDRGMLAAEGRAPSVSLTQMRRSTNNTLLTKLADEEATARKWRWWYLYWHPDQKKRFWMPGGTGTPERAIIDVHPESARLVEG